MKCPNCGIETEEGANFCTSCGAKLDTVAEPVQQPTEPVQAAEPEQQPTESMQTAEPEQQPTEPMQAAEQQQEAYVHPGMGTQQENAYQQPAGGQYGTYGTSQTGPANTAGETIFKVIKYYGIVISVLLILLVLKDLYGFFNNLYSSIRFGNPLYAVFGLLLAAIGIVSKLVMSVGFFTVGNPYKKEKINPSMTLVLGGCVLVLIGNVLSSIFALIMYGGIGYSASRKIINTGSFMSGFIFSAILFALLCIAGNTPYQNCSMDALKAGLKDLPNLVKESFASVFGGKKEKPVMNMSQGVPNMNMSQGAPNMNMNQGVPNMNQSVLNMNMNQGVPNMGMNQYGAPAAAYGGIRLKTDRSLLIYILLSLVTCGIYAYYFIYKMAADVNVACNGDGQKTQGLLAYILLNIVTCGIYNYIWEYSLGNRLAGSAPRYGMNFQENGTTVLMWQLFGVLLCGIGPFVAMHILIKNTNAICAAYNRANNLG